MSYICNAGGLHSVLLVNVNWYIDLFSDNKILLREVGYVYQYNYQINREPTI